MLPHISENCESFIRACGAADHAVFLEKMALLGEYLYKTNESLNLTAIRSEDFWSKHVADSLSPAFVLPDFFREAKNICDLGCGAGFPSLVLAAAFPHCSFMAVDSTRKKIDYVSAAARKIGLLNLTAVHARGNELGRREPYRNAFDCVAARAVASAETLLKESAGLLKSDGVLMIYRTPVQYAEERPFLTKNKKFFHSTTGTFSLPDNAGSRLFVLIGKTRSGT